ncbi:putative immunity protein [Halobacillus sp. B23F22_1]|uniref:putative immunity protein n=1 Tax=Halobacillus sp. B23F22_1 TaxID=3459514 RepID=UPI00373F4992
MFTDVEIKWKKKNKLLFSRNSLCLQDLKKQIQRQNHRTLVLWALDCASATLAQFEARYPDEQRPRACLNLCENWSKGKIKMPQAKRAILDAHAVAKELDDREYGVLAQAIGHAGATVHVETHAFGLPIYELTGIVHKHGIDDFQDAVIEKIHDYHNRLRYWQEHTDQLERDWAGFLLKENKPNKEKLLNEKRQ